MPPGGKKNERGGKRSKARNDPPERWLVNLERKRGTATSLPFATLTLAFFPDMNPPEEVDKYRWASQPFLEKEGKFWTRKEKSKSKPEGKRTTLRSNALPPSAMKEEGLGKKVRLSPLKPINII